MKLFKKRIKNILIQSGLWQPLNITRNIPKFFRWIRNGCRGPAPHPIKMRIIRAYLELFSIKNFVETGTYLGDTLDYIAKTGIPCISIELSGELYNTACMRFKKYMNVNLIKGDSSDKLPDILKTLDSPALFWLDGHYSAGITAKGDVHTPVSNELQAILSHAVKGHVILIDDARCFDGTNDYPQLDELLRVVRMHGNYTAEVSVDIIRLVPSIYAI